MTKNGRYKLEQGTVVAYIAVPKGTYKLTISSDEVSRLRDMFLTTDLRYAVPITLSALISPLTEQNKHLKVGRKYTSAPNATKRSKKNPK